MNTFEAVGYLTLWFFLSLALHIAWPTRFRNGYIMRAIRKIVHKPKESTWVWLSFIGVALLVSSLVETVSSDRAGDVVYWMILLGQLLDDYLNGDDDSWKKRWEGVKNKIKWLMELPPKPAEGQVQS